MCTYAVWFMQALGVGTILSLPSLVRVRFRVYLTVDSCFHLEVQDSSEF